jgi:hypothetical protein
MAATLEPVPRDDIQIFADHCVFVRSVYLHGKNLFELSTDKERQRMERTAQVFFGDINRVLIERVILEVCKLTDPARDFRKNDNLTVAFLVKHYGLTADTRLAALVSQLNAFRQKVLTARNKIISHSDRLAILAGTPLGNVPDSDWHQFWLDLQDVVAMVYKHAHGQNFYINGVGMLSDVDGLFKALKLAECFEQIVAEGDSDLVQRCADLALGS